jgi:S-adenosylmethionine:tRNA ribosyltransferase-isomerase
VLTSDFDFELPEELIAQAPVEPRDRCRLLVVRRGAGTVEHRLFSELPDLLRPGDCLVRNNSTVVPARLLGHREATGGKWEGLFLRELSDGWEVLAMTRGRPSQGERVVVGDGLALTLLSRGEEGRWVVRPEGEGTTMSLLTRHGHIPLPPYIRKGRDRPSDRLDYQTVYAERPGSVAAPTAGLHFTEDLFARLANRGVDWVDVTLHVSLGTFQPIKADRVEEHAMHQEWAELLEEAAARLRECRARGGRVVAVGTTSARTLETAASSGRIEAFQEPTDLFIRPGHVFHGLDALITNFHLPRSSLLVLVASLIGLDLLRAVYAEAIARGYRFFSYGDAMLIVE